MNLLSDYKEDVSKVKTKPGGYEWWYFDATDDNEVYQFVIIFYRGNPFSPRYHRKLAGEKPAREARPQQYPAISIAIYKEYQPIYYSFTEFEEEDCRFGDSPLQVQVGEHRLRGEVRDGQLCYTLNLKERLPCGDRMVAIIEYRSPLPSQAAFDFSEGDASAGHIWNLVQPRAEVRGSIRLFTLANPPEAIHFSGTGYHDHNTGEEPMSDEFREWYWGRFHFDSATLVYYVMRRKEQDQYHGWLISPDNRDLLGDYKDIRIEDTSYNVFGLNSARKITLGNDQSHVTIQQSHILDNGPFYQRFSSDAFLNIPHRDIMQASQGISEYIHPARIHWKLFRPLINLRLRYADKQPSLVQRTKALYRLTW